MEPFEKEPILLVQAGCFAFYLSVDGSFIAQKSVSPVSRGIAAKRLAREATVLPWFRDRALPAFNDWKDNDYDVIWPSKGYRPVLGHPGLAEMNADQIVLSFARMCEAIATLHGDGIVHGLLFPAGLWADNSLQKFKFCDVSLAIRPSDPWDRTAYRSLLNEEDADRLTPEQLDGLHAQPDARTDCYGLGRLFQSILEERSAKTPLAVHGLVDQMIARSLSERSASFGILPTQFRALSEGETLSMRPQSEALVASDAHKCAPLNLATVGRDEILTSMVDELEGQTNRTVLVRGPAGIGKSTVAQEFRNDPVVQRRLVIQARCEPARQQHPLSVWRKLARDLAGRLALEDAGLLQSVRAKVTENCAFEVQLLKDIVPEFKTLFGLQATEAQRADLPTDHAISAAISEIFLLISSHIDGLVLSIDDLHWADTQSLAALKEILLSRHEEPLFLLLISREGHGNIDDLLSQRVRIYDLEPLSHNAVLKILRKTFDGKIERIEELATLISGISDGHPLFLTQILHAMTSERALTQDPETGCWTWRDSHLSRHVIGEGLKNLLSDRVTKAPANVRTLLHVVSLFSDGALMGHLACTLGKTPTQVEKDIAGGLSLGLLAREKNTDGAWLYRLIHDWVDTVVREDLPAELYEELKNSAGLRLLNGSFQDSDVDQIIVDLMPGSTDHALEPPQQIALGRSVVRIACKERLRLNYQHAESLFDRAEKLLGDEVRQDQELMLNLATERVICAHAMNRPELVEALIADALSEIRDPLQANTLLRLRCKLLTQEERFEEALAHTARDLKTMGVHLPVTRMAAIPLVFVEVLRLSISLGITPLERLARLPVSRNRKHMARTELLRTALNPAYFVAPEILMLGGLKILRWSLKYGRVPGTCVGEAIYALAVVVFLRQRHLGHDIGEAACQASKLVTTAEVESQVLLIHGHFVRFWSASLRDGLPIFDYGYDLARRDGDQLYANFHILGMIAHNAAIGTDLAKQSEIATWGIDLIRRSNDEFSLRTARTYEAVTNFLIDPSADDAGILTEPIDASGSGAVSECYRLIKLCSIRWLSGRVEEALVAGANADRLLWRIPGQVAHLEHFLFYGLSLSEAAGTPGLRGHLYRYRLRRLLRRVQNFSVDAPGTFAQIERLLGVDFGHGKDSARSVAAIEAATEAFKAEGRQDLAAIAADLAARIMARAGLDRHGTRAGRAADLYREWGAFAQAARLHDISAQTGSEVLQSRSLAPSKSTVRTSTLDLASLQAIETLGHSQNPGELITGLLELAPAITGASYCAYVTQGEGALHVDMHASENSPPETVGLPGEALGAFRSAVLLYVGTTGKTVQGNLARDPMFKKHVRADAISAGHVACIPLVSEGFVFGMIYVEANKVNERTHADSFEYLELVVKGLAPMLDRFSMQARLRAHSLELQERTRKTAVSDAARAKFAHFVPQTVRQKIEDDPFLPVEIMEPKDISAVFLDVENFTGLSSHKSPTEVAVLLRKEFSSLLESIYEFGGEICETTGDGLLIVFQSADPNEHATAAVASAVKMREISRASHERSGASKSELILNFGINSGVALVGLQRFETKNISRWVFSATGQVINVAARHVDCAKRGDIIIGAETNRRVAHVFNTTGKGARRLKGLEHPVDLYSVSQAQNPSKTH